MLFPRSHEELVRIEQVARTTRQHRAAMGSVYCVMAVVLAVQLHAGFGWGAFAWQAAMAALAVGIDSSRLERWPTLVAGVYGLGWATALLVWAPASGAQMAPLIVAFALTHVAYGAATFYFLPWAVVAFSFPMLLASCAVVATAFEGGAIASGLAIVLLHGAVTLWFLRRNWARFVQLISLDAEKKHLADMLREQKEIAERAVQLTSRFLASASHDLRQPMHAISLYLGGLMEIDLPPRARTAVRDARECAYDMNDMFRSLLDIARLDTQQAVPTLAVFSLGSMLARIEPEFGPLAHSRDVTLRVRVRDANVHSDPVMIERIVQNFVSNAIRHTPGGRVLVTCRTFGQMVRVAVYDNGRGIPQGDQEAIFEEFRRLESAPSADHTGGLGLGLAIVRRLARTLRIPVVVRSAAGRGSMFGIELPLVHAVSALPVQGDSCRALAGKLVVLIDDEVPILHATSFILEKAGCDVIGARSGREALDALATASRVPDAIICDYELHDEWKGPAVIQALRDEFNSDIPALLVTGDTGGGGIESLARQMRVPLLYKPLESAALTDSLGSLLTA